MQARSVADKWHLIVLDDAAFLKVDQEDVAGHEASLGGNVPVGHIHDAHLTGHDLPGQQNHMLFSTQCKAWKDDPLQKDAFAVPGRSGQGSLELQ